ncbi:MAG: DegT/DnrJ/EryC1/StrS family aminotransferase [Erysipelotrichaceae bacterium]
MEFRDLKAQYLKYKFEIDQAIQDVLLEGHFIGGKQVGQLEERLAQYCHVKHCISCANGTEAMTILMMAWGIKETDAIFIPDFTFFSTGEIVSFRNATPVFVDVDARTFNIDPIALEKQINKVIQEGRLIPKVIIPVDLFGLPAQHDEIQRIAKKYNMLVLEDAAQGFGGMINQKVACSFGDAATTSFFPAKPLGAYGDGGAIFTNDDDLAHLLKSLKVHGKGSDKYDNVRIGLNSRLDTIQAAILNVKLNALIKHELTDINQVYAWYTEELKDVVETPYIPDGYYSSFAQYTIKLKSKNERELVQKALAEKDIPSLVYYTKTMHKQGAFAYLKPNDADYPVSNRLVDTVLSLPMHPYLSIEDVLSVCSIIKATLKTLD